MVILSIMKNARALESLGEFYVLDENTKCWLWNRGRLNRPFDYGRYRGQPAHRAVWVLFNGPIPDGMLICHHCDNPPCINPDHLFLGTDADNVQDAIDKGRRPHNVGAARLCSVDGCGVPRMGKGFCDLHYQRWRTHGDPLKVGKRGTHADNM